MLLQAASNSAIIYTSSGYPAVNAKPCQYGSREIHVTSVVTIHMPLDDSPRITRNLQTGPDHNRSFVRYRDSDAGKKIKIKVVKRFVRTESCGRDVFCALILLDAMLWMMKTKRRSLGLQRATLVTHLPQRGCMSAENER